jgi:hypothetical protein
MQYRNSRKQGDAGLGAAIAYFTRIGATVSIPLTDSQDYDLVVDTGGDLRRVQVKTTTSRTKYGRYVVSLRTHGGNRSWTGVVKTVGGSMADDLFVLSDDGAMFLIPVDRLSQRATLNLGGRADEFMVSLNGSGERRNAQGSVKPTPCAVEVRVLSDPPMGV